MAFSLKNLGQKLQDIFQQGTSSFNNAINDNQGFIQHGRLTAQPIQKYLSQPQRQPIRIGSTNFNNPQNPFRQVPQQIAKFTGNTPQQHQQNFQNQVMPIANYIKNNNFYAQTSRVAETQRKYGIGSPQALQAHGNIAENLTLNMMGGVSAKGGKNVILKAEKALKNKTIPKSIEFFADKVKKLGLTKEQFQSQMYLGLTEKNLTKKETAQNIAKEIKKGGFKDWGEFYDHVVGKAQQLPKQLERLAGEARKYKSAEEFRNEVLQPSLAQDAGKKYADYGFRLETRKVRDLQQSDFIDPAEWKQDYGKELLKDTKKGELPPITIEKDGRIIDGNHRLEAYIRAGIEEIPVLVKDDLAKAGQVSNLQDFYNQAKGASSNEIKRVADNLQKNNFGLGRTDAEAMARDVISNRPFNQAKGVAPIKIVKEKGAQIVSQAEKQVAPLERMPQQVQEYQATAPKGSGESNISGGGQKPPSSLSVPGSSKYNYNINKNKLKMTGGQKQTLDTVINTIKPTLEKVKGKTLSNQEVAKAAKTSEMLTKVTSREQTVQAEAAMLKARQRMVELNNNIDRLAKEGKVGELQTQMKDLIESTRVVSSTNADWGRKLKSLDIAAGDEGLRVQVLKEITKTNAKTEEILNAAKGVNWNDANSITKFYRQFVKPSAGEILDEYRYNNMLSNPKTHLRNAFSNFTQSFITRPATLLVEGKPAQAGQYLTGAMKSFPEAVQAFSDSFKGTTAIAKPDIAFVGTSKLPRFMTIPTRAMEAGDKFFTAIIQGGEIARGATKEQATKMAEYSLFRQGLKPKEQGPILNAIDSMTAWTYKAPKAVRWFAPFIRTPMNFAKQWIEYSPVGFATAYKAGNPREQIAKAVLGSTVTAFGAMKALEGKTTWAAPTDQKQKDAFYATGRKPFSINIGSDEKPIWAPMQYAGPFALALALPAAMKFYQEDNRTALTDSQIDKAVKSVSSMAQFFSQQTFLTGIGNFVNWASGSSDYSLPSSLGFTAQQIIPMEALISYINTIVDPVYRRGTSFTQSIQKNIPGLSQGLEPYTDPNGQPSTREKVNYMLPYDVGIGKPQYENQLQQRTQDLQTNAISNQLKKTAVAGGGGLYGNKIIAADGKTIDLSPPTTGQGIDAFTNQNWNLTKARDVYKALSSGTLTQQQAQQAYQKLEVDPQDTEYDYKAHHTTDIKTQYFMSRSSSMSHDEVINSLLTGRVVSASGEQFASNGVVDSLYNQGIISKAEQIALKKIKVDKNGKSLLATSGSGKKMSLSIAKSSPQKTTNFNWKMAKVPKPKKSTNTIKITASKMPKTFAKFKVSAPKVRFSKQFSLTA